ncbi:MAG: thioredoxin family protein [Gammaproteobacteria bacterium]|nr:thioredoxin family protein [Gammaproteobacteria bacterium]
MPVGRLTTALIAIVMLAACNANPEGALQVGQRAPLVKTKTLADVDGDFSRITSYRYPDERMYQYSLDEALQSGKPILLEFATPGHCTVCDVQLQMLKGLLVEYQNDIIFLHMDQYQNPEAFKAFRVRGDPWTFVIDRNQVVQYKQAGRMLYSELEQVIKQVLPQG